MSSGAWPRRIVVGPAGIVCVVDVGLHQAIVLDADGGKLRTVGGPKVRLNVPHSVAVAADGQDISVGFTLTGRRVQWYRAR